MPTTTSDGVSLHYETGGHDKAEETVVFVGEAGFGPWIWAWQFDRILGPYRTLAWDLPGTGRSDPIAGSPSVDGLADSLEAVLADAGCRRAHLVGVGLGGMIALAYDRAFDRARSLTLIGTAASGEAVDRAAMLALHDEREDESSLTGAFTDDFLTSQAAVLDDIAGWRDAEDGNQATVDGHLQAMVSFDAGPLYECTTPALVMHGLEDPVVPREAGETLAEDLPRATFEPVAGRHFCFIEHSRAVTDRLVGFLENSDVDA